MSTTVIDVQLLRHMFMCGAQKLESDKAKINELNVFPVPDGDTGTNMSMTIVSAVREILSVDDENDMRKLCKAISSGSLRGARGNSGVILSQLLRGFCKIVRDTDGIDIPTAASAFEKAVETAYKAVMKPKEGTILTVSRAISEKARELADAGMTEFDEFVPRLLEEGEISLAKTPDLLPVLKQAGVVDSGGQGLLDLLKGAYEGYQGAEVNVEALLAPKSAEESMDMHAGELPNECQSKEGKWDTTLKYGYAVTFNDVFTKPYNDKIDRDVSAYMQTIAGDIVTLRTDTSMRVQLKTNDPGLVLQRALLYGQLSEISIANLRCGETYEELKDREANHVGNEEGSSKEEPSEELSEPKDEEKDLNETAEEQSKNSHTIEDSIASENPVMEEPNPSDSESSSSQKDASEEKSSLEEEKKPHKELGMIAVCSGEGLSEIFRELGVDYIVGGGQTMNPSTEDILNAVDQVNADTIFIMPNNKNIIMAANQAAAISGDKKLIVIPTKTVPQGIAAAINFIPDEGAEINEQTMNEEIQHVKSAEVTYAVRDTMIDNMEIHEGNTMCIGDNGLLCVGNDCNETTLNAICKIADENTELISVYYGADTTGDEAKALYDKILETFPNVDVELQCGGQPVYYYIVSAE